MKSREEKAFQANPQDAVAYRIRGYAYLEQIIHMRSVIIL